MKIKLSSFFWKYEQAVNYLSRLFRKKRKREHLNKIRNETEVTTNTRQIAKKKKKIVREFSNSFIPMNGQPSKWIAF